MNTKSTKEQTQDNHHHEEEGHVHGPNCNHGHHHHHHGLTPYKRDTAKVGRNDPCPCGSQQKYKKCCGK